MAQQSFKASAPGTIMLAGEHAVLRNKLALCAAVDKRIYVTLTPREDDIITIQSELGEYQTSIHTLKVEKPFQFVLAAIIEHQAQLTTGFDLTIESEFSHTVGLGSSAAVTVATLLVLRNWFSASLSSWPWTGQDPEPGMVKKLVHWILRSSRRMTNKNQKDDKKKSTTTKTTSSTIKTIRSIIKTARTIIQKTQHGLGSGADAAACVLGGIVAYRMEPLHAEKLKQIIPVTLIYSGSKLPTADAVAEVNRLADEAPQDRINQQTFPQLDNISEQLVEAINAGDLSKVGNLFSKHQHCMQQAGLSTEELDALINDANQQTHCLGTKISGSGFGDCIVTAGELAPNTFPLNEKQQALGILQIDIKLSQQGARIEST